MARKSLKSQIDKKIRRSRRNVFIYKDFMSYSPDIDQVGRALRYLVKEKALIKVGKGLYAKAKINPYTGDVMLAAKGGFTQVAMEALDRLSVKYDELNEQEASNQVLANTVVRVKDRFNRKIAVGDKYELKVVKK